MALQPLYRGVDLIHHPGEPDGVRTRDAATTASVTGGCPSDRLNKYLHARPVCRFTSRPKSPNVPAEMRKS